MKQYITNFVPLCLLACELVKFSFYFAMQVLQWIQQPTDINSLRDFAEWKEKCDVKVRRSSENLLNSKTTEDKDDFHKLLCF